MPQGTTLPMCFFPLPALAQRRALKGDPYPAGQPVPGSAQTRVHVPKLPCCQLYSERNTGKNKPKNASFTRRSSFPVASELWWARA